MERTVSGVVMVETTPSVPWERRPGPTREKAKSKWAVTGRPKSMEAGPEVGEWHP